MQLIMEYVPLGSLRDYLPKHNVSLAHILLFAQQICEVKALTSAGASPKWGKTSGKKHGDGWPGFLPPPRASASLFVSPKMALSPVFLPQNGSSTIFLP